MPVSLDGDLNSLITELLRKAQMLEVWTEVFWFCFAVLLLLKLFEIKGQYSAEYNHLQFEPEMITAHPAWWLLKQLEECFVHYLTKEPFDYHTIDQKPNRVSVFFLGPSFQYYDIWALFFGVVGCSLKEV